MGHRLQVVAMTAEEAQAALARMRARAPRVLEDWFTAKQLRESRQVLDTLVSMGLLRSSCVTRSCPYYHLVDEEET